MQEVPAPAEHAVASLGSRDVQGQPAQQVPPPPAAAPAARPLPALKPDTASAPAAVADTGPGTSASAEQGGVGLLQQTLHQRLQQLLLPELGRQAVLQALDSGTQCLVECGSVVGIFSADTEKIVCLCSSCLQGQGSRGPEFMPSEFERHGGCAACKKWRFSIKVADAGPGMTLGRWLDMRGLQISSHPLKARSSTQRFKRPADVGNRGMQFLSAWSENNLELSGGTTTSCADAA
eukprot:gene10450-10609_t